MPDAVARLVKQFSDNSAAYKAPSYNETQVRREFIDVLLQNLGWDVSNSRGHPNALKEVIHEDSLRIGGNIKAPDYAIRVGGGGNFL